MNLPERSDWIVLLFDCASSVAWHVQQVDGGGAQLTRETIMRAHQSAEEFARANGFRSYYSLLTASRHIAGHDGAEHFVAHCPDGRELVWDEDDVNDLEADGKNRISPRLGGWES